MIGWYGGGVMPGFVQSGRVMRRRRMRGNPEQLGASGLYALSTNRNCRKQFQGSRYVG